MEAGLLNVGHLFVKCITQVEIRLIKTVWPLISCSSWMSSKPPCFLFLLIKSSEVSWIIQELLALNEHSCLFEVLEYLIFLPFKWVIYLFEQQQVQLADFFQNRWIKLFFVRRRAELLLLCVEAEYLGCWTGFVRRIVGVTVAFRNNRTLLVNFFD